MSWLVMRVVVGDACLLPSDEARQPRADDWRVFSCGDGIVLQHSTAAAFSQPAVHVNQLIRSANPSRPVSHRQSPSSTLRYRQSSSVTVGHIHILSVTLGHRRSSSVTLGHRQSHSDIISHRQSHSTLSGTVSHYWLLPAAVNQFLVVIHCQSWSVTVGCCRPVVNHSVAVNHPVAVNTTHLPTF